MHLRTGSYGKLVILGVGNVLLADEGIGPRVVQGLGPVVDAIILDGGTLALELLPVVEDAAALIIVDAADFGAAPGSVRVFEGTEIEATFQTHLSVHQVGVTDLLALARLTGRMPPRVALVAVQPAVLTPGIDLSPAAVQALPIARAAITELVRRYQQGGTNA